MKRSNGNSKTKKKGKNSGLNRKKSENSINLRSDKEGKKSICKCQDAIEKKEGNQAHQQKKCCKGESLPNLMEHTWIDLSFRTNFKKKLTAVQQYQM